VAWYAALSVMLVGVAWFGDAYSPGLFGRFIGAAHPALVVLAVCGLGATLLPMLRRRGLQVAGSRSREGLAWAACAALAFGAIVIPADLVIVHPVDMNVPWPESLAFYPVIGLMVEILFHLLPVSLLVATLPRVVPTSTPTVILWISLMTAAVLEPVMQVLVAGLGSPLVGDPHAYAWSAVVFDGLQVLAINVAQVVIFKRFDFVSMYALRLFYYGIWHIAWGHARLAVLF